jgi:hypothetical protein
MDGMQDYVPWQEYEDAVSEVYASAEGMGTVRRNIKLPDKVTGQMRQVDCLLEGEVKGHKVQILIDAKYRRARVDVKDVEETHELCKAVGAHKAIIVCSNGWTAPAEKKADFIGMDLRLLSPEDAADFLASIRWMLCPLCSKGTIILDNDGANAFIDGSGLVSWWLAGQCRRCKGGVVHCQDCGEQLAMEYGKTHWCGCGHMWRFSKSGLQFYPKRYV